jgi:dephospho-CoA kinase
LRLIYIVGQPGTGKSTLMNRIMEELEGSGGIYRIQTLYYHEFLESETIVLGRYDLEGFTGTDKLSMSVQPVAEKVMEKWSKEKKDWTVLAEGDRLANISFLQKMKDLGIDLRLFLLETSDEIRESRHRKRGDTQTATWLKGRETKCARIKMHFAEIVVLRNNTKQDLLNNANTIMKEIR